MPRAREKLWTSSGASRSPADRKLSKEGEKEVVRNVGGQGRTKKGGTKPQGRHGEGNTRKQQWACNVAIRKSTQNAGGQRVTHDANNIRGGEQKNTRPLRCTSRTKRQHSRSQCPLASRSKPLLLQVFLNKDELVLGLRETLVKRVVVANSRKERSAHKHVPTIHRVTS